MPDTGTEKISVTGSTEINFKEFSVKGISVPWAERLNVPSDLLNTKGDNPEGSVKRRYSVPPEFSISAEYFSFPCSIIISAEKLFL